MVEGVHVWIGGFRIADGQNAWAWEDGTPWDYSSWGPNEPNDLGGQEDYVLSNWAGPGLWNDEPSQNEFDFICQANDQGKNEL